MVDLIKKEEQQLTEENHDTGKGLTMTDSMKENLMSATKWIKFLNIVGCVGIGFLLLMAIAVFVSAVSNPYSGNAYASVVWVIIAAVYIIPIRRIFKFVEQSRNVCLYEDQNDFEAMFDSLRYVSRYIGIVTIVVLSIYAIIILIAACSSCSNYM